MASIILHGEMADKFGSKFEFFGRTGDICLQAFFIQFPEVKEYMINGFFHFTVMGKEISGESEDSAGFELFKSIKEPLSNSDEIHITPAAAGAGKTGIMGAITIIAGVVAVAAAFWTGGASLAAWGAMQWGLAVGGAMMLISGASMLMTKLPTATTPKSAATSKNSSFSSVDNMTGNGQCIPLLYGECLIGSMVASQQIETLSTVIA